MWGFFFPSLLRYSSGVRPVVAIASLPVLLLISPMDPEQITPHTGSLPLSNLSPPQLVVSTRNGSWGA